MSLIDPQLCASGALGRDKAAASAPQPSPGLSPPPVRRLNSRELLGDRQEVAIVHGELVYRLRVTSLGKLILTK